MNPLDAGAVVHVDEEFNDKTPVAIKTELLSKMPQTTRRKRRTRRMIGGVHYKKFIYEFKVGFSVHVEYNDTNNIVDVDDEAVTNNTDKIVEIFTKRLSKAIELGDVRNIRNIEFSYIADTYFQLRCELDIDTILDRLRFIEHCLEVAGVNEWDTQIPDLPMLDVGPQLNNNNINNEEYVKAMQEEARRYSNELIKYINISDINEYEVETAEQGRNLAALKTGFTKGIKADPGLGTGLANMSANVLGRIGSFLSGKNGTLNEQRRALRVNVGYSNGPKPSGGAGAPRRRRALTRRRRL